MGFSATMTANAAAAAAGRDQTRAEEVEARVLRLGALLRRDRQPSELRHLVAAVCSWPEVVHERADHAAWTGVAVRPAALSREEVAELDIVLGWLLYLNRDRRRIVAARAIGVPWDAIAKMDTGGRGGRPRHRSTLAGIYRDGIAEIADRVGTKKTFDTSDKFP